MPIPNHFGYVLPKDRSYGVEKEHQRISQDMPLMTADGRSIAGTGAGKVTLLHKVLEEVAGYFPILKQSIGDCVSFAHAMGVMVSLACDIKKRGEAEKWPGAEIATEWIYGTSRVLVGKGRLGNSDGSIGSWAIKALREHGTLLRKQYGSHDLTTYSGRTAKLWGYKSLPAEELEPTADEHPISRDGAKVRTWEEMRDAIHNGYPVSICSNQGFTDYTDSQGFCKPSGTWAHDMIFIDMDDTSRPGAMTPNSWGANWLDQSRGTQHDQPRGAFWVDADRLERMLRQDDSYAIPGYDGFTKAKVKWSLI